MSEFQDFSSSLFRQLFTSRSKMKTKLAPYIASMQQQNIFWIYKSMEQFYRLLTSNKQLPTIKFNALLGIKIYFDTCQHSVLSLIEIYLLPLIYEIAIYNIAKKDKQSIERYFYDKGYVQTSPEIDLGKLSANFVTLAREFILVCARIKQKRLYRNQQLNQQSAYAQTAQNLKKYNCPIDQNKFTYYKPQYIEKTRLKYLKKLKILDEIIEHYQQFYTDLFIQQLQNENERNKQTLDLKLMLRYSDAYITSDVIEICTEMIQHGQNFIAKKKSLVILNQLIISGDIQTYMLVNYGDFLTKIKEKICQVKGYDNPNHGQLIYPQLKQNKQDKKKFYKQFLKCVKIWASCIPRDQFKNPVQPSLVKLLHDQLQSKKFNLPELPYLHKLVQQTQKALLFNMQRNEKIIENLNNNNSQNIYNETNQLKNSKQSELKQSYNTMRNSTQKKNKKTYMNKVLKLPQIQSILQKVNFYIRNICQGEADLKAKMKNLYKFRDNCDQQLQNLDQKLSQEKFDGILSTVDKYIEQIQLIQPIYQQYLEKNINYKEFCHKIKTTIGGYQSKIQKVQVFAKEQSIRCVQQQNPNIEIVDDKSYTIKKQNTQNQSNRNFTESLKDIIPQKKWDKKLGNSKIQQKSSHSKISLKKQQQKIHSKIQSIILQIQQKQRASLIKDKNNQQMKSNTYHQQSIQTLKDQTNNKLSIKEQTKKYEDRTMKSSINIHHSFIKNSNDQIKQSKKNSKIINEKNNTLKMDNQNLTLTEQNRKDMTLQSNIQHSSLKKTQKSSLTQNNLKKGSSQQKQLQYAPYISKMSQHSANATSKYKQSEIQDKSKNQLNIKVSREIIQAKQSLSHVESQSQGGVSIMNETRKKNTSKFVKTKSLLNIDLSQSKQVSTIENKNQLQEASAYHTKLNNSIKQSYYNNKSKFKQYQARQNHFQQSKELSNNNKYAIAKVKINQYQSQSGSSKKTSSKAIIFQDYYQIEAFNSNNYHQPSNLTQQQSLFKKISKPNINQQLTQQKSHKDCIKQPQIEPMLQSYHQIRQLKQIVKNMQEPLFKLCFQPCKFLLPAIGDNNIDSNTMKLLKKVSHNNSEDLKSHYEFNVSHSSSKQFLQLKNRLLEHQAQTKNYIISPQKSSHNQNIMEIAYQISHINRQYSKTQSILCKQYSKFLNQYDIQLQKKHLLKNKYLALKQKQIQIGVMIDFIQEEQLKIVYFITPQLDVKQFHIELENSKGVELQCYPERLSNWNNKKQEKINIFVKQKQIIYMLPFVKFIFMFNNGDIKSYQFNIPCSLQKFVKNIPITNDIINAFSKKQNLIRTQIMQLSKHIFKKLQTIEEYLPFFKLVHKKDQTLSYIGTVNLRNNKNNKNNEFSIQLLVKQIKKMGLICLEALTVHKNEQQFKQIKFFLVTISHLLTKQKTACCHQ